MSSPFEFYEIVHVATKGAKSAPVHGELGAVVGRSKSDSGDWYYTVWIYNTKECWCFFGEDVTSIGEIDDPDNFASVGSVKVNVDDAGQGFLSDDDETMQ